MNYRQGQVLIDNNQSPDWAASHRVYITPVGASAIAFLHSPGDAPSGGQITVQQGHSFQVGDKAIISPNTVNEQYTDPIDIVEQGRLVWLNATPVVAYNEPIINVGPDSGPSTPNLDRSPQQIYSAPSALVPDALAMVSCDEFGNYNYWHMGDGRHWEVILDPNDNIRGVIKGFNTDDWRINVFDYGMGPSQSGDALVRFARWGTTQTAAGDAGAEIHFPGGLEYNIDAPLVITRGDIKVTAGAGSLLINNVGSGEAQNMFEVTPDPAVLISNVVFDGLMFLDKDFANHDGSYCFRIFDCSDTAIRNCYSIAMVNFADIRAQTLAIENVMVENNSCRGITEHAVLLQGTFACTGFHIRDNYFEGSGVDASVGCIDINDATKIGGVIADNVISGWGQDNGARVAIRVGGLQIVISDNWIDDASAGLLQAIFLLATSDFCVVSGNIAKDGITELGSGAGNVVGVDNNVGTVT